MFVVRGVPNSVHSLKIAPKYFEKVLSGEKTFEFRYNDRNYRVGDILILKEYNNNEFTGREISVQITYILDNFLGIQERYVILAIKPIWNNLPWEVTWLQSWVMMFRKS